MAPNTGDLLAQIYLRCILAAHNVARMPSAVYQHEDIFGKIDLEEGGQAGSHQVRD